MVKKESYLKDIWLVLVFFVLNLSCECHNSRFAQVRTGMQKRKGIQTKRKETSKSIKDLTEQRGQSQEEFKKTSRVEKESQKKDIAEQPDKGREKPSASQRPKSELMARLEGVRPATQEEIAAEEGLMEEITGLIIEQTMTKIGYEFYECFFLLWEAPRMTEIQDYNIFINERASPLWGIWIWIDVNGTTVWNKVLRPRSAEVEEEAKEAIEATKQYLINYEQYQFQSEDLVGTGI